MLYSEKIVFKACKRLGDGEPVDFMEYDQYVKNPVIINQVLKKLDDINDLYFKLRHSRLKKIIRTDKGSIAKHHIEHAMGAWDARPVYQDNNQLKGVIITVLLFNTIFVFKCGGFSANKSEMSGPTAFRQFSGMCKKFGIDLKSYKIKNGIDVKAEIEPSYIFMIKRFEKVEHVNHIDLNSAWASGVCVDFPEFLPVFDSLRQKNKLIPPIALGYCQSKYVNYEYSHLAKSGINNCKRTVESLMDKLINQDFEILGVNTDGIFYRDTKGKNRLYHDADEGTNLGQWRTDILDATFLAYSDGQYWFKVDGKLNVRARGYYSYEKIKAREDWDEHDFDLAMGTQILLTWDEEQGFLVFKGGLDETSN